MSKIISEIPDELLSQNLENICGQIKESYEQLAREHQEKMTNNDSLHEKLSEMEGIMLKIEKENEEKQVTF